MHAGCGDSIDFSSYKKYNIAKSPFREAYAMRIHEKKAASAAFTPYMRYSLSPSASSPSKKSSYEQPYIFRSAIRTLILIFSSPVSYFS